MHSSYSERHWHTSPFWHWCWWLLARRTHPQLRCSSVKHPRIHMPPTAPNHSFCRPLHVHIHECTSQLRHRDNLTEWCCMPDPEQNVLATRLHQHSGIPVRQNALGMCEHRTPKHRHQYSLQTMVSTWSSSSKCWGGLASQSPACLANLYKESLVTYG